MTQATHGASDDGGADAVAAQEHITLYVSIIEAKVIALRSGQDVQPMSNTSRWGLKREHAWIQELWMTGHDSFCMLD